MRNYRILLIIAIILVIISSAVYVLSLTKRSNNNEEIKIPGINQEGIMQGKNNMILQSPSFEDGGHIPQKYTCDGDNVSPPLKIIGVPEGTKSLALIVEDPDAPRGTFIHWIVYNIDSKTESFKEGMAPSGALEGMTSSGDFKYGGPCPPAGTHRYFFKLYALDSKLELPAGASKEQLEQMINTHILGKAELMGQYSRQF